VDPCFSRRSLLLAGGAGLGVLALAACGGDPVPEVDAAGAGDRVAGLADVPVGGALELSVSGERVILTQPTAGTVVGYDATCPHQGCTVRATVGGPFACPCHGSEFDPATGAVLQGPAKAPLTRFAVTVSGPDVVRA
jgi:Rieske Fe-S protein